MIKTYTYKIKPNKSVQRRFEEQVGICRYVYNLGREVREESFKKGVSINYFTLSKQLTEAKKDLEEDDFFRGWKRGCKEYLLKINGKWRLNLQEVLDF